MCRSCYERDLRERNPEYAERQRQNHRDWAKRNPDRIKALQAASRRRNAARTRQVKFASHLKKTYGMSLADWETRLESQGGKCALCRRVQEPWRVDHCHTTGVVRGILCHRCNLGLGMFLESPQLLGQAREYLEKSFGETPLR